VTGANCLIAPSGLPAPGSFPVADADAPAGVAVARAAAARATAAPAPASERSSHRHTIASHGGSRSIRLCGICLRTQKGQYGWTCVSSAYRHVPAIPTRNSHSTESSCRLYAVEPLLLRPSSRQPLARAFDRPPAAWSAGSSAHPRQPQMMLRPRTRSLRCSIHSTAARATCRSRSAVKLET